MDDKNEAQPTHPTYKLGPPNRAWRERVLTRASELETILEWFQSQEQMGAKDAIWATYARLDQGIVNHLRAATEAAIHPRFRPWPNGALMERVLSHLDTAEAGILRRAPTAYFQANMDTILERVRKNLPLSDPRHVRVEQLRNREFGMTRSPMPFADPGIESIIQALSAANANARSDFIRAVYFKTLLFVTALTMTALALLAGFWGLRAPEVWSLCFTSNDNPVCPTGDRPLPGDIFFIEAIGMLAASLTGAKAILDLHKANSSLGVLVMTTLLKLPTGALTAILGFFILRGGFVPGFSNLDSSEQIIAYAALFGAAQHLFTRAIDHQAMEILTGSSYEDEHVSVKDARTRGILGSAS